MEATVAFGSPLIYLALVALMSKDEVVIMQTFVAILCVALASCYLGWRVIRTWRGAKSGCGGGCGCAESTRTATEPTSRERVILIEQLSLRRR